MVAVLPVAAAAELGLQLTRRGLPPRVRLTLPRLAGLMGVRLDLTDPTPPAAVQAELPPWAARRVTAVDRVLRRWPFGDTCLRRCLVLGRRLDRLQPVLRIGPLRGPSGALTGHAWLEVGGRPLGEAATTTLVVAP